MFWPGRSHEGVISGRTCARRDAHLRIAQPGPPGQLRAPPLTRRGSSTASPPCRSPFLATAVLKGSFHQDDLGLVVLSGFELCGGHAGCFSGRSRACSSRQVFGTSPRQHDCCRGNPAARRNGSNPGKPGNLLVEIVAIPDLGPTNRLACFHLTLFKDTIAKSRSCRIVGRPRF